MITEYNNFIKEGFVSDLFKVSPENYGIKNYKLNKFGSLDIYQDVDMSNRYLNKIPFNINKIDGYLNLSNNKLYTLNNCPYQISGGFSCEMNNLTSLENGPIFVGGNYICSYNHFLKNLIGSPEIINKSFCITKAKSLITLEGCPKYIKEDLIIPIDKSIKNIEQYPISIIEGDIVCHENWKEIFNHIKNIIKENKDIFKNFLYKKNYTFHETILSFDPTLIKYYTQVTIPNKNKRLII